MLKVSQAHGVQWFCAICQCAILDMADALALHRPLTTPTDTTDLLIVHHTCRDAPLTAMLLPKVVKKSLVSALDMADEAANRG